MRHAPEAEQRRIVAAIEQQFTRLDAGVATLRRLQFALRRYRAAVLKAAVEGKLTEAWRAEHPDVEPACALLARILAERRARWEADLQAKGKDPAKGRYEEPAGPDTANLPELPKGWCWTTVEQVADNHDALRRPVKEGDRAQMHGEFPYYGASGIIDHVNGYLFDGEFLLLAEDGANLLSRSTPIAFQACGRFWPNNHAHIIAMCGGCPLGYLETFFNASDLKFSITGSAQPKLTQASLNVLPVPLPPLAEQEQIVAEVERRLSVMSDLETTVEANRKRAERLRQSILERAFSGQLVPQDPNDEPASVLLERIRAQRVATSTQRAPHHTKRVNGRSSLSRASMEETSLAVPVRQSSPRQTGLWQPDGE